MPYIFECIRDAQVGRKAGRPLAARRILPRHQCEEGDLRRQEAEAQSVVKVEILQGIRADFRLGALRRRAGGDRHQFGRDLGCQN